MRGESSIDQESALAAKVGAWLPCDAVKLPVNISVHGHRTSVRLEPIFMQSLLDIAKAEGLRVEQLYGIIDMRRGDHALSAALRLFAVAYWTEASGLLSGRRRGGRG